MCATSDKKRKHVTISILSNLPITCIALIFFMPFIMYVFHLKPTHASTICYSCLQSMKHCFHQLLTGAIFPFIIPGHHLLITVGTTYHMKTFARQSNHVGSLTPIQWSSTFDNSTFNNPLRHVAPLFQPNMHSHNL
jgi:hypothetical protein